MFVLVITFLLAGALQVVASFECGKAAIIVSTRILNGKDVEAGEWPWHGALYCRTRFDQSHQYRCGATLIGPRTVLTAAHCTVPNGIAVQPANILVKFGLISRSQPGSNAKSYKVQRIVRHERYDPKTLQQDIALLRTAKEVHFSEYIQPVCLPGPSQEKFLERGQTVGWGLNGGGELADILQLATLPVVDYTTCLRSNPTHFATVLARDGESNFCVGGEDKVNACQGDSGGGFFQMQDQWWHIRGIVSAGPRPNPQNHGLCDPSQYVTASNVSFFREWIDKIQNSWRNNLLDLADCGTDYHDTSIPEAEKPTFLQYPWITVQEYKLARAQKPQVMCGGVLIHPRFILLAGHCVCESCARINLDSVTLGDYNLSTDPDVGSFYGEPLSTYIQTIPVEKVIRYPASSNQSHYANDIALIKLTRSANLSSINVRPICIPTQVEQLHSNPGTITGWKRTSYGASVVQRESGRLVDSGVCEQQYSRIKVELGVRESFLCVEMTDSVKNCANFLSGTPLQYARTDLDGVNRYYLGGLYAFGLSRCNLNFTDVYVNVSFYGQWIKGVVDSEIGEE